MLQEKQRTTHVIATATSGTCTYDVNYALNDSQLTSLNCTVSKKVTQEIPVPGGGTQPSEQVVSIGNMARENGTRRFSFPDEEDIAPHIAVFNQIIEEVQDSSLPKGKIAK